MKLLSGKTVLITGASRGIGAATAKLFAKHGANVGVNYLNSDNAAQAVVATIEDYGSKALALKADVRDEAAVADMFVKLNDGLGEIDVLVVGAAVGFSHGGFLQQQWADFNNKLSNELKSAFLCAQAAIKVMQKKKSGKIIIISSDLSRTPSAGFIAHSTAKSALDAFAKSLAQEFGADGISVNVIAPGFTQTDATAHTPESVIQEIANFTPLQRVATPEDIANAILFMASEMSDFMTGTYTPVNGGLSML